MEENQSLRLEQRIGLRLSQQQLRFVKLLELNASELDDAVSRELEDNPALEISNEDAVEDSSVLTDDGSLFSESSADLQKADYVSPEDNPLYKYDSDYQRGQGERSERVERSDRGEGYDIYASLSKDSGESLYEHLERQLDEMEIDPQTRVVAEFIIGSLDTSGYLRRSVSQLIDDMAFGPGIETDAETVEKAIAVVQSLEPYGVGATDLRDCMLIQLRNRQPDAVRDIALAVVEKYYSNLVSRHWDKIKSGLKGVSSVDFEKAMKLIRSLNPKPGGEFSSGTEDASMVIVPDFTISNEEGRLVISLGNSIPELRIEQGFEEAMANLRLAAKGRTRKGSEFVVNRYNDARDFIKVLGQRQETMMSVMTAIVDIQKEYFLTRDVYKLKPMKIKDIAALTGLDISVISRATANKYVQAPWGIFPLRYFFSEGIGEKEDEKDVVTNRKIEAEIEAIVKAEDKRHPLSDQNIMDEMARRGFEVSRRTVAKYRDRKGIPVARLRKEWK